MNPTIGLITSRVTDRLVIDGETSSIPTPFGDATIVTGTIGGTPVTCVERYASDLSIPSHKINYRANIWALRSLGVRTLLSQNAIGSLNRMIRPGDIVIPHDLLDRTYGRANSFFDDYDAWVRVDMTHPFCPRLRSTMIDSVATITERYFPIGTFACTQGPRLESPAEIAALATEGGDIVGTPVATEAVLAKEAGMCFGSIAPIINWAAGLAPEVNHAEMNDFYYSSGLHEKVEDALARAIADLDPAAACQCHESLDNAYFGVKPEWLPEWRLRVDA